MFFFFFFFFVSWENNRLILSVITFMLKNFPSRVFILLSTQFGLIACFMDAMNVVGPFFIRLVHYVL